MNQEVLVALARQERLLKDLMSKVNQSQLGLIDNFDNKSCKIYCNRHNNSLWYTLDGTEPIAVNATALIGYLKELRFERYERRKKEVPKLLATIQADKTYILEAGHDSHFSKGLLIAVSILNPEQLLQPLTFQPHPGDSPNVLFCRILVDKEPIVVKYDENTNWREVAQNAIANVRNANSSLLH